MLLIRGSKGLSPQIEGKLLRVTSGKLSQTLGIGGRSVLEREGCLVRINERRGYGVSVPVSAFPPLLVVPAPASAFPLTAQLLCPACVPLELVSTSLPAHRHSRYFSLVLAPASACPLIPLPPILHPTRNIPPVSELVAVLLLTLHACHLLQRVRRIPPPVPLPTPPALHTAAPQNSTWCQ